MTYEQMVDAIYEWEKAQERGCECSALGSRAPCGSCEDGFTLDLGEYLELFFENYEKEK